ncbi:uncharacterized protein, partial [Parasteatoda tepidariorum]|uniref:uncharacterized protein n=1 Tax=Parasteatoda tepidariorum TaxID=114398 RepID=UPI0039BCBEB2
MKKEDFILSIKKDLDFFIAKISRKYHWPVEGFSEWKAKIIERVKFNLFNTSFSSFPKGTFIDYDLSRKIKNLKDKFIVTVVDKASNNFCIMCKYFFKKLIIGEYNANNTYLKLKEDKKVIEKRIIAFSKKLKFKLNRITFPYLFPIVKFHKNPIKFRFIACGTNSYNSDISKRFFCFLKIILLKIKKEKNIIIESNVEVLDFIKSNDISSINTFDFENLYTSIPHEKIIEICEGIYDKYLFDEKIDRFNWLDLCKFNLFENVLFNGLDFYKQIIGIPQGNSFSGAFANIFLHFFEAKFLEHKVLNAFRYIDDLILFNCDNYNFIYSIYPGDLV